MDPKHIPSKIIECAPVGPLTQYIEPYVVLLREQGYASASLHEHVRVIVMFSQSLQRSGCEIRDLDEAVVERFLYHELRGQWPHVSAPATLRRLLAMLRQIGAVRAGKPAPPRSPAQQLTDDYRRFLLEERAQLPLPMDVGQAIAGYLHRDRPQCSCRSLFIRDYAPLVGFGVAHAISKIVRCALEKAGVESARKGAHLLRHSLATDMLRNGASLEEIGEVLRHKSPDSTAIYAKVELDALKPLALSWPGGVQ